MGPADPNRSEREHTGAGEWIHERRGGVEWYVHPAWHERLARAGWLELERWRETLANAPAGPAGRGRIAWVRLAGGGTVVLKQWRRGGLLAPLWRETFPGKARFLHALDLARMLEARGIPTPRPVVLVLQRAAPLLYRAWMATEGWEGARSLRSWLIETGSAREREGLLEEALVLVRRLHDAGFHHPDLNLDNLLARAAQEGRRWGVVDLDRMRARGAPLSARARRGALRRLQRSWAKWLGDEPGLSALAELYAGGDAGLARALRQGERWGRMVLALHRLRW